MPNVIIYHNPSCSKSRRAVDLLLAQGITPTIIEYLSTPPNRETLKRLLSQLNLTARDLMRQQESIYQEKHLDSPNLSEEELIQAMVNDPILIQRPIVVVNQQAIIGRPPERILEILDLH